MKLCAKNLFLLPTLIGGLGLILIDQINAQTLKTLHNFTGSDGDKPYGALILSSNTLYGTTHLGGSSGYGTVFAVNMDGTGFTTLRSFTNGSDGANLQAGLILSGNILYGTAYEGGIAGRGTIFAINTDGTGFTNLHKFTGSNDGSGPRGGLILSGNTLYGTSSVGGSLNRGTIFAIDADGSGFTNLHSFTGSEGTRPYAGLVLSGNILYGTTYEGGSNPGSGTVFAVSTSGTSFTTLHTFRGNDGAYLYAGLILSSDTLYGMTTGGGGSFFNNGTVFAINTNGTGFTNLHKFTGGDGYAPTAGLILSGNTLYGAATGGGSSNDGTVFAIHTNGTSFTNLHSFMGSDGYAPYAGLILSSNTLYGTTSGFIKSNGTVFSLSFAPQLQIIPAGTNMVLTWPTNVAGFSYDGFILQSTTDLVSPAVWNTNSPAPFIVNGRNTVTNPVVGSQNFYRLSR